MVKEMTMEELCTFEKVVFEDHTKFQYDKCWNGGCYSYTDVYTNKGNGWEAAYMSSSDFFETEYEDISSKVLLGKVNKYIKMVNGDMPFYMQNYFVEVKNEGNKLIFFMDRKDRQ